MTNCKKCGNPETMYWCSHCESNGEKRECLDCKRLTIIDIGYHEECSETKPMTNQTIELDLTINDLEDLISGEDFEWYYTTNKGQKIVIHLFNADLMNEEEENCLHNFNDGICKTCGVEDETKYDRKVNDGL